MLSADREILFSFGRYTCSVTGSNELLKYLPVQWNFFLSTSPSFSNRINIRIEEQMLDRVEGYSDGWHVPNSHKHIRIVYIHNGKAIFALQYSQIGEIVVCIGKRVDSYIRMGVQYALLLALFKDCIGLHGLTLLCDDEIIILSAPSGTGKTTLAKLLEEYCDAVVINGDFALLSLSEEGVVFEPTPFCGTSRRCLNHRLRIDRVVFLEQAENDHWYVLSAREAMNRFMSNAFIPTWDVNMQQTVQENIINCITELKVNAFAFAPYRKAAEVFYNNIRSQ